MDYKGCTQVYFNLALPKNVQHKKLNQKMRNRDQRKIL